YDVSPMYKYRITGKDAARVVDRLITRDVARLKTGRAFYAPWCDGKGRVIEDGTLFRLAENDFRLNAAEQQLTWLDATAWGFEAQIRDVTEELAGLALQGPLARAVLQDLGLGEAASLAFFGVGQYRFDGIDVTVSRTGFTGDLGFELWVAPDDAGRLWDRLMALEKTRYIKPIGSRAVNTARIEAGHILINVEYASAARAVRNSQTRTPYGLGLGWAVDLGKSHFTGRQALLKLKQAGGPKLRLVGLDVAGRKPAHGAYLYSGRKEAGQVTSAVWSPVLKRNIALATVDARHAAPGTILKAEIYYVSEVMQKKVDARAVVVDHRFYRPAHRNG
ncbi:MAG TPA: aminomethyltransferase family protein, partial [Aestuariivirgaceae bacterium]|nr:aminomethyltransferase family protein [Aestuariivirgaceae bacterium]